MTYNMQAIPTNQYYYNSPYNSNNKMCMNPFSCNLKVTGQGSVNVKPDLATVVIGVITENEQLTIAQEENTIRINQILKTLEEMGIPSSDIQTQSYNINPIYDYVDGKKIFKGYRVVHDLRITIKDMTIIGEIIDAAVQNGANQVSNIDFSVEDTSVYYRQALALAIDDAYEKARTLGRKLNIVISNVPVQIVEEGYQKGFQVEPNLYQRSEASTQIQTGETEIIAKVNAIYAY